MYMEHLKILVRRYKMKRDMINEAGKYMGESTVVESDEQTKVKAVVDKVLEDADTVIKLLQPFYNTFPEFGWEENGEIKWDPSMYDEATVEEGLVKLFTDLYQVNSKTAGASE